MSSSSCLPLLTCLSVTSILLSIFPLVTCFRRQVLRKNWPIQSAFLRCIACRIFLSTVTQCNISFSTWFVQLISILLQHQTSVFSSCFWYTFRSVQFTVAYRTTHQTWHFTCLFLNFKSNLFITNVCVLLNPAFAMKILDLILRVRLVS